jgi:hypothetical protein
VLIFIYTDGYLSQPYEGADWINQDQDRNQYCGCCAYGNELQGPFRSGNALNNDYYVLKYYDISRYTVILKFDPK